MLGTDNIRVHPEFFAKIMAAETPEDAVREALLLIAEENEHYLQTLGMVTLSIQESEKHLGANRLLGSNISEICKTFERLTHNRLETFFPLVPDRATQEQLFAKLIDIVILSREGRLLNSEEEKFNRFMAESYQRVPPLMDSKTRMQRESDLLSRLHNDVVRVGYLTGLNDILSRPDDAIAFMGSTLFNELKGRAEAAGTLDAGSAKQVWQDFARFWRARIDAMGEQYNREYRDQPHEIYAKAWAERVAKYGVELLRAQQVTEVAEKPWSRMKF